MKQYCTSEEDIETLFTYFQAAINGEENKELLKRLFDLQCGVMRSRPYRSERDKVLDELRIIKQYDRIRFHQKHTLPKSWVEVKVMSVSKDGKRIDISGILPGGGCTTEMGIDLSDVRQVCRWIELRQAGEPDA